MLKPAILYKDQLLQKFSEDMYSSRYFYYTGYAYDFTLPKIEPKMNYYQFAIVNTNNELIGYLAYTINAWTSNVYNFGLYSFDEGNLLVIRDTLKELERLVNCYHRVEWRCIGGNHAMHGYDSFCKKHNGTKYTFHDILKDINGNYLDEYYYEIINNNVR